MQSSFNTLKQQWQYFDWTGRHCFYSCNKLTTEETDGICSILAKWTGVWNATHSTPTLAVFILLKKRKDYSHPFRLMWISVLKYVLEHSYFSNYMRLFRVEYCFWICTVPVHLDWNVLRYKEFYNTQQNSFFF